VEGRGGTSSLFSWCVLLVSAADVIPDIFDTLLNVTADMTALCVVSRFFRGEPAGG
jgi:Na+/H+-dicarboxylate symporter